jgi:hypothetical protein
MENTEVDYEKTEEEYEYEAEQIHNMFPNAQFTVAISIELMEELVTDKQSIIIKKSYFCYCYDNCKRKTDYFYIKGQHMTYRYVIEQLIEKGLKLDCNHCYLEGFCATNGSDCQFDIMVGS